MHALKLTLKSNNTKYLALRLKITVLAFLTSLFFHSPVSANKCKFTMLAGPYFTASIASSIYGDFFAELEKDTNCTIQVKLSESLAQYYRNILTTEVDIFLISDHSLRFFETKGYSPILASNKVLQAYVVIHPDRFEQAPTITSLRGKTILSSGSLSGAGMYLDELLKTHDLKGSLNHITNDNHAKNIYSFLTNEVDAIVAFNFIYNKLPDYIKSSHKIVAKSDKESAILMAKTSKIGALQPALIKNAHHIKQIKYQAYKEKITSAYSTTFEKSMRHLLSTKHSETPVIE